MEPVGEISFAEIRHTAVAHVLMVLVAVLAVGMIAAMFAVGVTWATGTGFLLIYGIGVALCIATETMTERAGFSPDVEALGRRVEAVLPLLLLMADRMPQRDWILEIENDWRPADRVWDCLLGEFKVNKPAHAKPKLKAKTYRGSYQYVLEMRALGVPMLRQKPKHNDTSITYNGLLPGEVPFHLWGVSDDPYCTRIVTERVLSDEEYDEAVAEEREKVVSNPDKYVDVKRRTTSSFWKCID